MYFFDSQALRLYSVYLNVTLDRNMLLMSYTIKSHCVANMFVMYGFAEMRMLYRRDFIL